MQDTHFTADEENFIQTKWGYKCFFSSYRSNARGVSIFLTDSFEYVVHNVHKDNNGNMIALNITIEKLKLTLINIYAPNEDSPHFFSNIQRIITEFYNSSVIICGDFNLVLNPELDYYQYKSIGNPRARNKLLRTIEDENLNDIYRHLHSDTKRYTWRKKSPLKQSRLDFFLLSEFLIHKIKKTNIVVSYIFDHYYIYKT